MGHIISLCQCSYIYYNEYELYEMFKTAQTYLDNGDYDKVKHICKIGEFNNYIFTYSMYGSLFIKLLDYKQAEKYLFIGINKGCKRSLFTYAHMCDNIYHDYQKAEQYYLKAINKGCNLSIYNLSLLYEDRGEYKKAEKYYLIGINLNFNYCMYGYADLCEKQFKDYDNANKYYLMAIEHNNKESLYSYGKFCSLILKDNETAKKYLQLSIEQQYNVSESKLEYQKVCDLQTQLDKLQEHDVIKTLEHNEIQILIDNLKNIKYYCKLYYYLIKNPNYQEYSNKIFNYVDKKTQFRMNRIKRSCVKIVSCPICYESNIDGIDMECGNQHYICIDCIDNINECPFKC